MRWSAAFITLALAAAVCSLAVPGPTDVATASIMNGSVSRPIPCGGGLRAVGGAFCTHGGDLVPGSLRSRAFSAPAPRDSSATDPCVGDGASGRRVRVYYGYPSDTPENASTYRTSIKNCRSIVRRRAPSALRVPISFVRSFTLT